MNVRFILNGASITVAVEPSAILLDTLRELGARGVKAGCRTASCGTCTVLMDGRPVPSCSVLTAQAEGAAITTIEGLGDAASPGDPARPLRQPLPLHGVREGDRVDRGGRER